MEVGGLKRFSRIVRIWGLILSSLMVCLECFVVSWIVMVWVL